MGATREAADMAVPVVRLFVLGVIRMHGEAHGYAVHRELASWRIDTWTRVKPGSIYHALKQVTKEGLLRVVGTEDSSEGPGRTLYALTRRGETEFRELLEDALRSIDLEELGAGVAFMQALPRERVLELLDEQHRQAEDVREGLKALKRRFPERNQPPHTQDLLELWRVNVGATAKWTAELRARVAEGAYHAADDTSQLRKQSR